MRALFLAAAIVPTISLAGNDGIDYSANPVSFAGLALVVTIPANEHRLGVELMVSCAAGAILVLDDAAEKGTPTAYPMAGASANGAQGSVFTTDKHTGRVRVYSSNTQCAIPARAW